MRTDMRGKLYREFLPPEYQRLTYIRTEREYSGGMQYKIAIVPAFASLEGRRAA